MIQGLPLRLRLAAPEISCRPIASSNSSALGQNRPIANARGDGPIFIKQRVVARPRTADRDYCLPQSTVIACASSRRGPLRMILDARLGRCRAQRAVCSRLLRCVAQYARILGHKALWRGSRRGLDLAEDAFDRNADVTENRAADAGGADPRGACRAR